MEFSPSIGFTSIQHRGVVMFSFPKLRIFDRGCQKLQTFSLNDQMANFAEDIVDEPGGAISLICVGALTPSSAAADLLEYAALWVEGAQGRSMNISWVGEGDLRGVLSAQPLPETLSQRFFGDLSKIGWAAGLAPADLLCVLHDVEASPYLMHPLLAADNEVIVAEGCKSIVSQLRGSRGVWLFDERRPATLMAGLEGALETTFARRIRRNTVISENCLVYA
jgi:hypothetical protein